MELFKEQEVDKRHRREKGNSEQKGTKGENSGVTGVQELQNVQIALPEKRYPTAGREFYPRTILKSQS
jgi:hypothetical protein